MWFMGVQLLAAIAASARGWKVWPFVIYGALLVFASMVGSGGLQPGEISLIQTADVVVTFVFLGMAIIGRKSNSSTSTHEFTTSQSDSSNRIRCPHCAEIIMREAKVCRFCGRSTDAPSVSAEMIRLNPDEEKKI